MGVEPNNKTWTPDMEDWDECWVGQHGPLTIWIQGDLWPDIAICNNVQLIKWDS